MCESIRRSVTRQRARPRPEPLIASKSIRTPLPLRSPAISGRDRDGEVRRSHSEKSRDPLSRTWGGQPSVPSPLQPLEETVLPGLRTLSDLLASGRGEKLKAVV